MIINWKLQSAIIYYPTCWIADVPLCTQCFPVETFVITVICPWGQVTNQGDVACQVTSHCWLKHTQSSSRDTTMHFSWFTVFMETHSKGYKGRKLKRVIIVPCLEGNTIKTFQFCWSACPSHQSSMKCPNNYMDGLLLTLVKIMVPQQMYLLTLVMMTTSRCSSSFHSNPMTKMYYMDWHKDIHGTLMMCPDDSRGSLTFESAPRWGSDLFVFLEKSPGI